MEFAYLIVVAIVSFIVGLFTRDYLPGYARQKGQNLAAREDSAVLIKIVEEVKLAFSSQLEDTKAQLSGELEELKHNLARKAQFRSRTTDKLEEIGRIANSIMKSGLVLRNSGLNIALKDKLGELSLEFSQNDELLLLVKLYEPALLQPAEDLVEAEMRVGRFVLEKFAQISEPESPLDELLDELNKGAFLLAEELESAFNKFMHELGNRFSEYRL